MILIVQYRFRRAAETQQNFLNRCLKEASKTRATVTVNGILVKDYKLSDVVDDECVIVIQ